MAARGHKAANKWVARIIPVILIGLIIYSAYVITKVVAIDYLINPPSNLFLRPRPGAAAALLLFYYLLVIPVIICYARLIQTIVTNPGYVPRSEAWYQKRKEEAAQNRRHGRGQHSRRRPSSNLPEKPSTPSQSWPAGSQDPESGSSNYSSLTTTKEHRTNPHLARSTSSSADDIPFWQRDIFICNPDGRPPSCSSCLNHKPDRSHHCSEVDRCVQKMDHFCPWVGGIVSETSFKFFIQFLVYAAMFCILVLTTISVFIAERRKREGPGFLNVHYFVILGVSALFLLFTVGMAGSSIQLSLVNSTTVENLNRRSKVWFIAVLIPRTEDGRLPPLPSSGAAATGIHGARFQTITYPRPPEEEQWLLHQAKGQNQPALTTNTPKTAQPAGLPPPRTFAILSTKPGENPFDIGTWNNIREVMGYSFSEWVLPIKQSPCADHRSRVSRFVMDEGLVRRLKKELGLVERRDAGAIGVEGGRSVRIAGGSERRSMGSGGEGARVDGSGPEDYGSRRKKRRRRRRRIEVENDGR
jgi:palmitoyltransferase